ncbi:MULTISPECIES: hypothetical protein [unclassified Sphingobium]|uniref:hypothetical protein n=1 Tax=unclassified Sphingobium TaxID=2611147 RepID=UPI00083113E3|nr:MULTISPECIES: hypothetical protein [unclassified Sphingobium]NML89204.1 hypothetical protein [Sphingobium sp. TB-6]
MSYMFQDLAGLALATLLAPLVLYLPGLGLVRLLSRAGLAIETYWQRIGWAMLLGLAILPVFDTLLIRVAGIPGMLLLNGMLALWGTPLLKGRDRITSLIPFLLLAVIWWLICAWSLVDVDMEGKLYQSLIAVDMVKHAAVVEQIVHHGIPFADPFFARDGIAGYYHYFYAWPAAIKWIGGEAISARMAFSGTIYWTGFGVVALLWRVAADAAFIRPGRGPRLLLLAAILCFVAGADLLFMLLRYLVVHRIEPELDSWNTEIRMLGTSVLWVPHHVSAMAAAWTGMLLVTRATPRNRLLLGSAAGAAFATMFGESVWIALAIAPLLMGWTILRLSRRDFTLFIAGAIALLLSFPQLHDIIHGRAPEAFPIAFSVRPFTVLFAADTPTTQLWCLILLPLNYGLEFGLCGLGAYLYWRRHRRPDSRGLAVRQLLLWSTITTLFIGSFFKSVIINNDLGWRAVLFPVMAVLIWTLRLAQSVPSIRKLHPMALALLALGSAGTAWDLFGMRLIRLPLFAVRPIGLNNSPSTSYAQRQAYEWADRHLPPDAVLQHNPSITLRAVDFGLYGRHWPAVADEQAYLFGAGVKATADRMASLSPIFTRPLPAQDTLRRVRTAHIDYLLFAQRDPIWRRHGGPPAAFPCVYRSQFICIAPVPKADRP